MRVWFPDFFTEAHRTREHGLLLVAALADEGVECVDAYDPSCEAVFCGSIYKSQVVALTRAKVKFKIPVVQYNWDIYPWHVEKSPDYWLPYIEELKVAAEVWVPSLCTVARTIEFAGRNAFVIKTSVRPWEHEPTRGDYVVDVMRKYPDRNADAVRWACNALGIPVIETATKTPWEEFKKVIAGARLLVSAYQEASTAGLTLLEGYYLGKTVLLSDSLRNGGRDYFGDRASYFKWDSRRELTEQVSFLYNSPLVSSREEAAGWVKETYSEAAMARPMAARLRELVK